MFVKTVPLTKQFTTDINLENSSCDDPLHGY